MGTPTPKALAAKEAPLAMLIPMGVLTAASVAVGLFPGLLLVPIAAIQAQLGMEPVAATLTGPLPGLEGWSPVLLSVVTLILATALLPWLRLGHRAGIVRTNVHLCGVTDAGAEAVRTTTAGLYETPDAVIRRALFVSHRAGEGEEA
jgi:NADH:ubiquinone oxidoreductase subunit 5 (subunit L)/multisubunit Na+/H+ antiporter MnhA subunit